MVSIRKRVYILSFQKYTPPSKMAEVTHSSCYLRGFSSGTGPSYMQINSRKDGRNVKTSFTVLEEDSYPIHCNNE